MIFQKYKSIWLWLLMVTLMLIMGSEVRLFAQRENLPRGLGGYNILLRQYSPQSVFFDQNGKVKGLGDDFSFVFSGPELLKGKGGARLKELAQELKAFDANSPNPDALLNSLYLGQLEVDVDARIQAQAVGVAYGLTNKVSLFLNIPFIKASVKLNPRFDATGNNALAIRDRLGALAFDELRSGLEEASRADSEAVIRAITDLGYQDPRSWSYSGLGDVFLGGVWVEDINFRRNWTFRRNFRTMLELPTGYQKHPDYLSDFSSSRGTYFLYQTASLKWLRSERSWLGVDMGLGAGLPRKVKRRVPLADEALIAKERTQDVQYTPGLEHFYGGQAGFTLGMATFVTSLSQKQRFTDHYKSSQGGNTARLSSGLGSGSRLVYWEGDIRFQTVDLFEKKKFPVPLIFALRTRQPISGRNHIKDQYYELSVSSFFRTPNLSKSPRRR